MKGDREHMQKKFEAMDDYNLSSNLILLQEQIHAWMEQKPNNESLKTMSNAIVQVSLLVAQLQHMRSNYHLALGEYRRDYYRALDRARDAEAEVEALNRKL